MLSYGLLLGLILQATGTPGQPDAAQIFRAAIEAADIRSQGPFLLEAKITATSKNALEGKYRLIFQSESHPSDYDHQR